MKIFLPLFFFILTFSLQANEKITLQLNWKYQFEFAGFIAAKEKGFYNEMGLDVALKEFENGTNLIEDLKTSRSTYGAFDLSLLSFHDGKEPLTLLANYFKRSALVIIANQNIVTPQDLKSKKIMATESEIDESTLATLLKKFNINKKEFTFIPHTYNAEDFISGKVDAFSAYVSNELYYIQKAKKPYTIIDPINYGINGLGMNIFATAKEIKQNPIKAKKFIDATNRGWLYALNNKNEIVDLIYNKYSKRKSKEALLFEANEIEKLIMPNIYKIGEINKSLVEKNINELLNEGVLKEKLHVEDIVFNLNSTNENIKSDIFFTKEEKKYLENKKVITMCIDPDWMPYEKIEKGKHVGMSSDYMKILEENIGVPIKLVPTQTWTQSIEFAQERKCDIFSLAMETPSRKKYMNFTKPYISFPIVIATKMDKLFIPNVKEIINEKPLGIVKGYAFLEILKNKYPKNKLVEVNNVKEGLTLVVEGKLFGFIGTLATVGYELQNNYIGELKIAGKFDETWNLGIGTRNDEPQLVTIFDKGIDTIGKNREQEILNRWVSVKYEESIDKVLILQIVIFFLLIIAFIIYRNRQLKEYNEKIQRQSLALEKANEELNKTKQKLEKTLQSVELVFDCVIDAIFIYEQDKCIDVNDVAVKMLGYGSKEEMKGLSISDFAEASSLYEVKNKFKDKTTPYEVKVVRKDGTIFPGLAQGTNVLLNDKKVRISALVDISEIKNKEQLLIQQSKMAAMGEMIGNIAHQWRQPLNIISTTATGLKLQIEFGSFNEDDAKKELDRLNHTVQLLSQTIDDFRNFFKSEKEIKIFSLKEVILKNINLLDGMFRAHDIEIVYERFEDLILRNFENEFIQALMNILYNAKDALDTQKEKKYIFVNVYKNTNKAVISIKDNGGGIKDEVIDKIFEPYFTTKHKSQGTGIGLYMSHQIIEEHMHGKIEVQNVTFSHDSAIYRGAQFTITFELS